MKEIAPAKLATAAEASIVALARLGDQSAFEELVRRRQSHTRNLLRRLCRNTALADDLAQETFLKAWQQLRNLQSIGAFSGWLQKIAVNTWLQHIRSSDSFVALDDVDDLGATPILVESVDLDSALGTLNPSVRLCIVLSYHEGMSHGEIASITQIPLGTVKSHIARGTARLRELLAAYDSTHERQIHAR